eukprot:3283679-Pyramimonas_sp.AAC.1
MNTLGLQQEYLLGMQYGSNGAPVGIPSAYMGKMTGIRMHSHGNLYAPIRGSEEPVGSRRCFPRIPEDPKRCPR